jgi:GR25 family glycosyltransferase involved in LPS biosynthesis
MTEQKQTDKYNKSVLNTVFEKIYIINRYKKYDSRSIVFSKLKHMNIEFEFFEEINGYDSQYDVLCDNILSKPNTTIKSREDIAVILTYMKLLEKSLINQYQSILILNDNVLFHKDFDKLLHNTKHNINFAKIDCVWLGSNQQNFDPGQKNDIVKPESQYYNISNSNLLNFCTYGIHAIGMNRKFMDIFRKSIDLTTIINNIDVEIYSILNDNTLKGIVIIPSLIIVDENNIFEPNNFKDYDELIINRLCKKDSYKYIFEKDMINFKFILGKYNISLRHIFSKYCNGIVTLDRNQFVNVFINVICDNKEDKIFIINFVNNFFEYYEKNATINLSALFDSFEYQKKFVFIVPSYNNIDNYVINLNSIKRQIYPRHLFRTIYLLDKSDDGTSDSVRNYIKDNNMGNCIEYIELAHRQRQAFARYIGFHKSFDDEICINLDGDDWLYDEFVLENLNNHYTKNNILVSYGSYYVYDSTCNNQGKSMGIPYNNILIGTLQISSDIKKDNMYRNGPWQSVHLRSAYAKLFKSIELRHFIDHEGKFFKMCTDYSEMYPVLEMSNMRNLNICKPMLVYNKYNSELYDTSYYRKDDTNNRIQNIYRNTVTKLIKSRQYYSQIIGDIVIEEIIPTIKYVSIQEVKQTKVTKLIENFKSYKSDYLFISDKDISDLYSTNYKEIYDIITQYYRSKPGALLIDMIQYTNNLNNPPDSLEIFINDKKLFYSIGMFADKFCGDGGKRNPGKHIILSLLTPGFYNREKLLAILHDDQNFMNEVYMQKIMY